MLFTYEETAMNKYFLKYKFAYLLAIPFATGIPQNTIAHAHIIINQFGKLVQEMIYNVDTFLDKKNKQRYCDHVKIIDQTMNKHPLTIRSSLQSELEKQANSIGQEFKKPFIAIQRVLQKYQGKNKKFAGSFVKDLGVAFPVEQFFLKLKTELMGLKKNAIKQDNIELIKTVNRFIAYIDQKIIIWRQKSQLELFGALCQRMELH